VYRDCNAILRLAQGAVRYGSGPGNLQTRLARVFVWRRIKIPEGRLQAEAPKDGLRLLGGSAAKIRIQPVAVPEL
jgi:hypothetical protein